MRIVVALAAVLALIGQGSPDVGRAMPEWTPGTLDIHHISTGRGNATFVRLPGGRTLLIDAGAGNAAAYADQMPDASKRPGQWIADYIRTFAGPQAAIDVAVLTHFHADHIGGIADVAAEIPIRRIVDRGSPDYAYLRPADTDAIFRGYREFLAKHPSITAEAASVGSTKQIVDEGSKDAATVRIVAANDRVWTGKGDETKVRFPALDTIKDPADRPTENMCSVALRVSYGPFDYFTGGDMPGYPVPGGPAWHDLESDVARALGATEVRQIGHHGSIEVENPFFLSTMRSRVLVLPAWAATHPSADVLKRMLSTRVYPDPRDIFVTQFREPTKASIGARATQVASDNGHVVVRVESGGARYRVYVLDNTTSARTVKSVHGPYESFR